MQYLETFKDKLLPDNNPYEQRVSRIAQRLLEANPEIKDLMHFEKWKVFVINEPDINAFVLPVCDKFKNFSFNCHRLTTFFLKIEIFSFCKLIIRFFPLYF